jgi:hypothetical protein
MTFAPELAQRVRLHPIRTVDLLEALANPCHEVQRLLAMADDWRSD